MKIRVRMTVLAETEIDDVGHGDLQESINWYENLVLKIESGSLNYDDGTIRRDVRDVEILN